MRKRVVILLTLYALVGCGLVFGLVFVLVRAGRVVSFQVQDVTRPWKTTHKDLLGSFKSGEEWVQIKGQLDGNAVFKTSSSTINLKPGPVDYLESQHEYWCEYINLEYMPSNVTKGSLTITVSIGSSDPVWLAKKKGQ